MRTVTVEKSTHDVMGLLDVLRSADPPVAVVTIGSDQHRTYVYLEDYEIEDPTALVEAWEDVSLKLSPTSPKAADDIHEVPADGSSRHVVTMSKCAPRSEKALEGDEELRVSVSDGVPVSDGSLRLHRGVAEISVGPCSEAREVLLRVVDQSRTLCTGEIRLRFTAPKARKASFLSRLFTGRVHEPAPPRSDDSEFDPVSVVEPVFPDEDTLAETPQDPSAAPPQEAPATEGVFKKLWKTLAG